MNVAPKLGSWQPPASIAREEVIARSDAILAKPDLPWRETEDIFRIHALGLDWDLGVRAYEPADSAQVSRGADGKRIGIFLLHGGSGDYKSMAPMAGLFSQKIGRQAAAMTIRAATGRATRSIRTAPCAPRSGSGASKSRRANPR